MWSVFINATSEYPLESLQVKVKVAQSCLTLCDPMDNPWNSPGKNTGVDSLIPSPGDLPNPGIEPRSPALQVDSLPAEPRRKPKNTRVGSLSLLQRIFPTQGSNWGLLLCRLILYQLSYQGSPNLIIESRNHQRMPGGGGGLVAKPCLTLATT